MPFLNKSTSKPLILGVVLVALFGILYIGVLRLYQAEDEAVATKFSGAEAKQPGYLTIYAKLASVDPIKGDLSVRLEFEPTGSLAAADGTTLTKNLLLNLNSSTGKTQVSFKKGERMNPTEVIVEVYGEIGDYPFDTHAASLIIELMSSGDDKEQAKTEEVPFIVDYTGAIAGYKIEADEKNAETGYTEINMTFARSTSAFTFAIFIMVLEWLLALSALAVTVTWISGRKIEVTMFGWMGALLFALIPLRNAMPAVPPVGIFSDFLAFFWAEAIVALSLVAAVVTWILRPIPK